MGVGVSSVIYGFLWVGVVGCRYSFFDFVDVFGVYVSLLFFLGVRGFYRVIWFGRYLFGVVLRWFRGGYGSIELG